MDNNFCIIDKKVYQIVNRYGVKHFKGKIVKCNCSDTGCKKIRFSHKDVAMLYSKYRFLKYGEQLNTYWSHECQCYHLTTSKRPVWEWG